MEPWSATYQTHGRQARFAADSTDADAGGGGVGAQPVVSALAVPDDPLDGVMQCLGVESGFAVGAEDCLATGAWFDDFRGGSMDMSTHAGVDFLEMLLDVPVPDTTSVLAADDTMDTEKAATRAEAVSVPHRPAATMNPSPSFSSSAGEDDARWMSSSDSSSEDDAADDHWLPCESKKGGSTKRRLRQNRQPSASGGQCMQHTQIVLRPAPHSAVEGGGGGDHGYRCHQCFTETSPLWRAGPDGPKTLCNACGLRRRNKPTAPTRTKRLPAAKPTIGSAKSNNYSVVPLAGGATVVRKKRSVAFRIG